MKGNKKLLALASAALLLGACAQETVLTPDEARELDPKSNEISFGTYMGKNSQTRAGYEGPISTTELQDGKSGIKTKGFGVFAVYSGNGTGYNALTDRTPNFMYNEQVYYDASTWKYDNIKYWPNGRATTTAADDENATSESVNKVSFFAYAPYVSGDLTTETSGITRMSANTDKTNPKISYTLSQEHFVDLLWGTSGTNGVNIEGGAQNGSGVTTDADGTTTSNVPSYGNVNVDMTKQKVGGKVTFLFKHALAGVGGYSNKSYGGLSVIADVDDGTNETGGTLDDATTKVTITSITISNDKTDTNSDGIFDYAIPTKGVFDLATGSWITTAATSTTQLTFNHVIKNSPLTGEYELNDNIKEPASFTNWESVSSIAGVKSSAPTNVYKNNVSPLLFLPGTTPSLKFTITYQVRTKDDKLSIGCTNVTQTITKTVTFDSAVQTGNRYNILIHLGLTGIKFSATVEDWDEDIDNDGNVDQDDTKPVNLPINVQ